MAELKKMVRAFGKYYLATGILSVLFVITRAVYVCRREEIAFMGTSVKRILQAGGTVRYRDVCDVIMERVSAVGLIGSVLCIFVLGVFSCGRYLWINSRSSEEFLKILPVREGNVVLFDYLMVAGMIVVGGLIETMLYLLSQTNLYHALLTVGSNRTDGGNLRELITVSDTMLVKEMLVYVSFMLFLFTWLYLGSTIVKNRWLGMAIVGCVWYVIWVEESGWTELYDFMAAMQNGDFACSKICLVLLAATVLMQVCIFLAGKYREQTNGTLFYFPVLDFPFAAGVGYMVIYHIVNNMYELPAGIIVCLGFAVMFFLFIAIHPFSGTLKKQ